MPFGDAALIQPDGIRGGYDLDLAPGAKERQHDLLVELSISYRHRRGSQLVSGDCPYLFNGRDPVKMLTLRGLEREGLVTIEPSEGGFWLRITPAGRVHDVADLGREVEGRVDVAVMGRLDDVDFHVMSAFFQPLREAALQQVLRAGAHAPAAAAGVVRNCDQVDFQAALKRVVYSG